MGLDSLVSTDYCVAGWHVAQVASEVMLHNRVLQATTKEGGGGTSEDSGLHTY